MASSAPPDLNASSAAATAAVVASVAAASVCENGPRRGHLGLGDDRHRAERIAHLHADDDDVRLEARPPGSVPSYSDRGPKSWSCSTFSSPLICA